MDKQQTSGKGKDQYGGEYQLHIDRKTYLISLYFNQDSKATLYDKLSDLMKEEIENL